MLAVDHGYFQGPTTGLVDARGAIAPLAPLADTLMLTRGILRSSVTSSLATPIVLRVSGGNSVLEADLSNETIITSVEECIRLNAAGMALSIFVGWVMVGPIEEAREGAAGVAWFGSWRNLLRYAVPAFLFFVLVYDAIPSTFETIINLF